MRLKQDQMSSRERIEALFNRRKPDRVSISMGATAFASRNAGLSITEAYGDPEKIFEALLWTVEQYGWDPIALRSRHTILGAHDFGGEVRLPKGEYEGAMVVVSPPVKNARDVQNLKIPDPRTAGAIELGMRFARLQRSHGLPATFFSRSPMTEAANICGLEQFCRWIIKAPELCRRLLDMTLVHISNVLQYWVDTFKAENVFIYMSSPSESNQVISPRHFETFALPYHLKYHEIIKRLGVTRIGLHICGEQNLNLPIFAEASPWVHPSILSFGHEVDLDAAMKLFPEDIIYGNIEPAKVQTESPGRVYEMARQIIEKGKKAPGGYVFSTGCELPKAAPPANVFAITKAVHDSGWY